MKDKRYLINEETVFFGDELIFRENGEGKCYPLSMRVHPYLKFYNDDFRKKNAIDLIAEKLQLPENEFPPRFFEKKENYLIAGYFAS